MKWDLTVIVVGAGIGGIAAAITLAAAGAQVTVIEATDSPGGKMREVQIGGRSFDAGPTVLTMKWVFDELLARCGTSLENEIALVPMKTIARHYWQGGQQMDLYADARQSADAIGDFAGSANARGYERFCRDSRRVYETLERTYISAQMPNPVSLSMRIGLHRPLALAGLRPFSTLWTTLQHYFSDPRLVQLFGRYATYCGSSPFAAPATLMLVAHVEQAGVWQASGGMKSLAKALARVARRMGVSFSYDERVVRLTHDRSESQVNGVETDLGRSLQANAVIYNGDVGALDSLLHPENPKKVKPHERSLSALVACCLARAEGVPLAHHTVFFAEDYRAEFDALFRERRAPDRPTVYVCAQDRNDIGDLSTGNDHQNANLERIYMLMNMPADGDARQYSESELHQCLHKIDQRLAANGLEIARQATVMTAPDEFAKLYPGSSGALYGMASHGWQASFRRKGSRGPMRGLYLAGGSVHPGPGVPMTALSGRLAAEKLLADLDLIGMSRRVVTGGGISTRQANAESTPSS